MSYYSSNLDYSGDYYDCKHCEKRVWRNVNQKWIKSYCTKTEKTVHLTRAKGSGVVSFNKNPNEH